jgi:hypothetical protein
MKGTGKTVKGVRRGWRDHSLSRVSSDCHIQAISIVRILQLRVRFELPGFRSKGLRRVYGCDVAQAMHEALVLWAAAGARQDPRLCSHRAVLSKDP